MKTYRISIKYKDRGDGITERCTVVTTDATDSIKASRILTNILMGEIDEVEEVHIWLA